MLATITFSTYSNFNIVRNVLFAVVLFLVLLASFAVVATVTPIVIAYLVNISSSIFSFVGCLGLLVTYVYVTKP